MQIRALARDFLITRSPSESSPRRRTQRYVEEPDPEISRQSAEMRARSRDVVRIAGWASHGSDALSISAASSEVTRFVTAAAGFRQSGAVRDASRPQGCRAAAGRRRPARLSLEAPPADA